MRKKTARDVLDRLKLVFEAKNDSQLSEMLGEGRSTVGSWVSRGSIPYAICVDLSESRGISLDWLLTGDGPMYRGEDWKGAAAPALSQREDELLAIFRLLDEPGQQSIRQFAEEKRTSFLMSQQMHALNDMLQFWAETGGKSASANSGPLMDRIKKYLSLTEMLEGKKGNGHGS